MSSAIEDLRPVGGVVEKDSRYEVHIDPCVIGHGAHNIWLQEHLRMELVQGAPLVERWLVFVRRERGE